MSPATAKPHGLPGGPAATLSILTFAPSAPTHGAEIWIGGTSVSGHNIMEKSAKLRRKNQLQKHFQGSPFMTSPIIVSYCYRYYPTCDGYTISMSNRFVNSIGILPTTIITMIHIITVLSIIRSSISNLYYHY